MTGKRYAPKVFSMAMLVYRLADAHAAQSEAADSYTSALAKLGALQQQAGNTAELAADAQQKDAKIEELAELVTECQDQNADLMVRIRAAEDAAHAQQLETSELRWFHQLA